MNAPLAETAGEFVFPTMLGYEVQSIFDLLASTRALQVRITE